MYRHTRLRRFIFGRIRLIVFYMSAGFFAVFFTAGFMELSRYMKIPELWAGLGRAVNNLTAAVIANGSLMMLASGSSMTDFICCSQHRDSRLCVPSESHHGKTG